MPTATLTSRPAEADEEVALNTRRMIGWGGLHRNLSRMSEKSTNISLDCCQPVALTRAWSRRVRPQGSASKSVCHEAERPT